MDKNDKINYLKTIRKYFKLTALCQLYNERRNNKIDYNNLRETINNYSSSRLSEERLDDFIMFISTYFIPKVITLPDSLSQPLYIKKINDDFLKDVEKLCKNLEERYKNDI